MNRTPLRLRAATATAAVLVTVTIFHSVASMARPTAVEQVARAKATAVVVASARAPR
jgi:hypothetical protein